MGNPTSSRTWMWFAASALLALTSTAAQAGGFGGRDDDEWSEDGHEEHEPYAIGLWGDLPYSTSQADTGIPNLIADMNAQQLAFTAHDLSLASANRVAVPAP